MWNREKFTLVRVGIFVLIILCFFFYNIISLQASNEAEEKKAAKEFLKEVINAYYDQSDTKLAEYYSLENIEGSTVAFEEALFLSFQAEELRIEGIECLENKDGYLCMGAYMTFILKDGSEMPFYEYYLLLESSTGGYTAVSEDMYPLQIRRIISINKKEWELTELYCKYQKAEDIYERSYPGYADAVYDRLILLLSSNSKEMKENLHMVGVIFVMGTAELLILCIWVLRQHRYYELSRVQDKKRRRGGLR